MRAVELLRQAYASGGRKWPRNPPTSFLRPAWRETVWSSGELDRRIWEAATLLALRDRLRAGDIWVEGSRQWRAIEDQLIPSPLFAAMREAGPLPVAAPATAAAYLAERKALLKRRLAEVAAKAAADKLRDVRIEGQELKITPLKATTPEEAEDLADRLYAMLPNVRITGLLAEVDRWTGFSAAFTHLHTGLPADDRRVALTAVLADATNLGLTRMADACAVASYRQLAWTAGWHLREETYRHALAAVVNAQQQHPLAAVFGAADEKLIAAHWDDVLRLAASVRTGTVSASLMLKRLGAYPRQNGLALALREIGRIERTLFTLDWLESPELRRQATAELNKGEARNALARAVCFHRLGRLRDRAAEAQQHRASGLALVTAAIALWNTTYLDRAIQVLRRRGEPVPNELLAHLAPVGWQHINLTGDYLWDTDASIEPDGFRPLRHVLQQLPVAASSFAIRPA
jgi:hypothetical protein